MENIENSMFEHLKRFQSTLERVESKTDELIVRMGHLEVATAATKREVAHVEESHADLSVRLERVERRLELQ
jgi:ubiquinone biosynthesis protein UbiJ